MWLTDEEVEHFKYLKIWTESKYWFISEANVKYSEDLYESFILSTCIRYNVC